MLITTSPAAAQIISGVKSISSSNIRKNKISFKKHPKFSFAPFEERVWFIVKLNPFYLVVLIKVLWLFEMFLS